MTARSSVLRTYSMPHDVPSHASRQLMAVLFAQLPGSYDMTPTPISLRDFPTTGTNGGL